MYKRLPTATRAFIRMHAPCSERSSIRAVRACTVPDWSSHNASTKIITAVRGSSLGPLMLPSIGNLNEQFNHHPPLNIIPPHLSVPVYPESLEGRRQCPQLEHVGAALRRLLRFLSLL